MKKKRNYKIIHVIFCSQKKKKKKRIRNSTRYISIKLDKSSHWCLVKRKMNVSGTDV